MIIPRLIPYSLFLLSIALLIPTEVQGQDKPQKEFIVYSVFRGLDMGDSPTPPPKDYYVNIGTTQGVRQGTLLEVLRRIPTYDLVSRKLQTDQTFPIARIKVIHVESGSAIARLEKLLPEETTPSVTPRAVMVGDLVRTAAR